MDCHHFSTGVQNILQKSYFKIVLLIFKTGETRDLHIGDRLVPTFEQFQLK